MMSHIALLVSVPALVAAQDVLQIPKFYTSGDCTGAVDPDSKKWGLLAGDGKMVYPFDSQTMLPDWAVGNCLSGSGLPYSVKLVSNLTRCSNGDAGNQFQFAYYGSSTQCLGTPTMTDMTLGTCVTYSRGSMMFSSGLSPEDTCAVARAQDSLLTGSMLVSGWAGTKCVGNPVISQPIKGGSNTKACSQEPDCEGCCRDWDSVSCQPEDTYEFVKMACDNSTGTLRFGMNVNSYTDSQCSSLVSDNIMNNKVIEANTCFVLSVQGQQVAMKLTLQAPITVSTMCGMIDVAVRNNIDPLNFVTWSELNAGSSATPMHCLALLMMLVTLLMA